MANNFSFSSFNKERLFTFDCIKIAGNYTNLEAMFQEDGEGKEYQIKGVYISTSSQFDPEAPIVALSNTYVNLPQHQLADIKAMLANKGAINAINAGLAGFTIRQYETININYTVYDPSTETPNVTLRATYVDENGNEYEFLTDYFEDIHEAADRF